MQTSGSAPLAPASTPGLAIYVHIPWCASLCPYCDFVKQATDFGLRDAYLDALLCHITAAGADLSGRGDTPRAASLYFGGGTPSLFRAERLGRIVQVGREHLGLAPEAEVTVEANPSDVVTHTVEAYLRVGVNRLSLGVQSLDDDELHFLGRRHTADKARRAVAAARAAGCTNLSLDLMYGLPGQTSAALERSLEGLIALQPEHVSCYALTLEEETPLGAELAAGRLHLPDDDLVADQYALIQHRLAAAGFHQYEISNWARPGLASAHNLTYWRNGEWLGLGAGAAGSWAGLRYQRTPVLRDYIAAAQAGQPGYVECEPWTPASHMRDTLMLGLRLAEGVSNAAFRARYGTDLATYCSDRLPDLVAAGVLRWQDDRLVLDPASNFVCNAVLAEILPGE